MRAVAVALALVAALAIAEAAFPFSGKCARDPKKSRYSTDRYISMTQEGLNTYCWVIEYSNTCETPGDYCCNAPLDKFMLNVRASCAAGTKVSASLNGNVITRVQITRAPNAGPEDYTLNVGSLALNQAQARDAQVCITLSGTCDSLEELLPEGQGWQVALWDDDHRCCPTFEEKSPPPPSPRAPRSPSNPRSPGSPRSPRSPSVPRSPRSPSVPRSPRSPSVPRSPRSPAVPRSPRSPAVPRSPRSPAVPRSPRSPGIPRSPRSPGIPRSPAAPPPPCETCWVWEITGTPLNIFTTAGGAETAACTAARANLEEIFGRFTELDLVLSGFELVSCSSNSVRICGAFRSTSAAQDAITEAGGAEELYKAVFTDSCSGLYSGRTRRLTATNPAGATDLTCGTTFEENCRTESPPPPRDFPYCECVKRNGATPFGISPEYTVNGREYCVAVTTSDSSDTRCGNENVVYKFEFWFNYAYRFSFDITIKLNVDGSEVVQTKEKLWGKPEENTLRVSDLNWTRQQVEELQPQICFTFTKEGRTLENTSMGGGRLWWSAFNPSKNCCPTWYSGV